MVKAIRAEYDGLREVARVFAHHADLCVALTFQIEGLVDQLQGGAWRGVGAEGFFAEMGEIVLPAMRRLEDALQFARDSTLTIVEIMQAAEDEAAALFRGLPGGEISHPQQDDEERRRQVLKEIQDLLRTFVALARDDDFGDQRDLQDIMAAALSNLSQRFPDLARLDSLTLAELIVLLEDLRRQAQLLSLLHSAYVLSGRQGGFPGWEWAGLPFEQLQALFDDTRSSPWRDWLFSAFYTPLWMLSDVKVKDTVWSQFLNFTPAEQIAFLMGLQQMIRENGEYGGFTVGEVSRSGILPVMNALAHLKYALDQVAKRAQDDPDFAVELGGQKGMSELDAGDLDPLVGGIFGLSKFGRDDGGGRGHSGKDDDSGKNAEGVIKPSLLPDPDRKPEGKPTEIHHHDVDPTSGIRSENDAAVTLAQNGWRVEQNPDPSRLPDHIRTSGHEPDYIIEGVVMDCYAPQKDTSMKTIWDTIRYKVEDHQADGVVIDLNSRSDIDAVIKYLNSGDIGIQGIRTVIGVKDGKAFVIYPKD